MARADPARHEELPNHVAFLPGTTHVLAIHDDAEGMAAVYEMDIASGKDVRQAYSGQVNRDVWGPLFDRTGKALLGVELGGTIDELHWVDPAPDRLQHQFTSTLGDRIARIVSLSADRKRMLVRIDRPDSPGGLNFYDVGAPALCRIAWYNHALRLHPANEPHQPRAPLLSRARLAGAGA